MSPSKTIMDLLRRRDAAEREAERLRDMLRIEENNIQYLDHTIRLMGGESEETPQEGRRVPTPINQRPLLPPDNGTRNWEKELRGRSHIDAIRYIARTQPDMEIKIPLVRTILLEAGLSHGSATYLNSQLHRLLKKKGSGFDHVGPGRFRLKPTASTTDPDTYILQRRPDHYRVGVAGETDGHDGHGQ